MQRAHTHAHTNMCTHSQKSTHKHVHAHAHAHKRELESMGGRVSTGPQAPHPALSREGRHVRVSSDPSHLPPSYPEPTTQQLLPVGVTGRGSTLHRLRTGVLRAMSPLCPVVHCGAKSARRPETSIGNIPSPACPHQARAFYEHEHESHHL